MLLEQRCDLSPPWALVWAALKWMHLCPQSALALKYKEEKFAVISYVVIALLTFASPPHSYSSNWIYLSSLPIQFLFKGIVTT